MSTVIYTSLLTLDEAPSGTVEVQDAGTTTPRAIYTDTGLSVAATNPIPLDSAGRATQGIIYTATGAYKVIVKDSGGSTIYTRDNIDPGVPVGSGALAIANGGTGATVAATALSNLGGATAAELADVAADVAALSGTLASSEKTHIATGTTAQRPASPAEGDIRRNTTTSKYEGYTSSWENFLTSADLASQATMEAASSTTAVVSPGNVKFNPGVAKAWGYLTTSGGTPTLEANSNIASIVDNGVGAFTFNFTTAMATANYAILVTVRAGAARNVTVTSQSTTAFSVDVRDLSGNVQDPSGLSVLVFGDFA